MANIFFLIILKQLHIFIINSITKCTHFYYKQYYKIYIINSIQNKLLQIKQYTHINARSIRNKVSLSISFMLDHNLDLLFITETWLTTNDSPIIAALNTPPYLFTHLIRDSNNFGGGIGILHRSTLNVSAVLDLHHSHSESLTCSISPPRSHTFNIALFYRPPIYLYNQLH